jgi:hypothetical protein
MGKEENETSGEKPLDNKPMQLLSFSEKQAKIREDLDSNPKYKFFFDQYSEYSAKYFKDYWAEEKAWLIEQGDKYVSEVEYYQTMHSEYARKKIWEIQQRKLFDLNCLWRAEQIKIPEIRTKADFPYWSSNIENCTFLSPITQEEFDRYLSFVNSSDWDSIHIDDPFFMMDWQAYDDYKLNYFDDSYDDSEETPAWYEYYELATGLSSLYDLPDIRGEKEKKYSGYAYKKRSEEWNKDGIVTPYEKDNRPSLSYLDDETVLNFVEKHEEFKYVYAYKCRKIIDNVEEDDELTEAVELLKTADEPIYLSSELKWRASVIDAANSYKKKKLIEELPKAFKNYLFRVEKNIPFESVDIHNRDIRKDSAKAYMETVIEGRLIAGEPGDLNF